MSRRQKGCRVFLGTQAVFLLVSVTPQRIGYTEKNKKQNAPKETTPPIDFSPFSPKASYACKSLRNSKYHQRNDPRDRGSARLPNPGGSQRRWRSRRWPAARASHDTSPLKNRAPDISRLARATQVFVFGSIRCHFCTF